MSYKNTLWIIMLFIVSTQFVAGIDATCTGTSPPVCDGSAWTISDNTYCYDGDIILCGNMSVNNINFKAKNVTIYFNGTGLSNATQRWYFANVALMEINDSIITTNTNPSINYYIDWFGQNLSIRNTNISNCGNGTGRECGGMYVNNILFINNTIHDVDFFGSPYVMKENATFIGNNLYNLNNAGGSSSTTFVLYYNNLIFTNNTVHLNNSRMNIRGNNTIIENNDLRTQLRMSINDNSSISYNKINLSTFNWLGACYNQDSWFLHQNLTISGNELTNCYYGIYQFRGNNTNISYNNITNTQYGIYMTGGNNTKILNNRIDFSYTEAIYVHNTTNPNVSYNNVTNFNRTEIWNSYGGTYSHNWFYNCTLSYAGCLVIDQTNNSKIHDNICYDGNNSCIQIAESIWTEIYNNQVNCINITGYPLVRGITGTPVNSLIYNNTIVGCRTGIILERVYDPPKTLDIGNTNNISVYNNTIIGSKLAGIYLSTVRNLSIYYNNIIGNGSTNDDTIYAYNISGLNLSFNSLSNAPDGFRCEYCDNLDINNNTFNLISSNELRWNRVNNTLIRNNVFSNASYMAGTNMTYLNNIFIGEKTKDAVTIDSISSYVNFLYNNFSNTKSAIVFNSYTENNTVIGNRIEKAYGTGILFYNTTQDTTITGNLVDIQGGYTAISLIYADNITLSNNTVLNNSRGIYIYRSNDIKISDVYARNSTDTVSGCINIDQTNNSYVTNSETVDCLRAGIFISESINTNATYNYVHTDKVATETAYREGINHGGAYSHIYGNNITGYYWSIWLSDGDQSIDAWTAYDSGKNLTVYNNIVNNSYHSGIEGRDLRNISIYNNIISECLGTDNRGMRFDNTTISISGNSISNCDYSINLTSSTVNSSNDLFDTSIVFIDSSSQLDKWFGFRVYTDRVLSGLYVFVSNSSGVVHSDTTVLGSVDQFSLLHYQNIGGSASTYQYNANVIYGSRTWTEAFSVANPMSVPYVVNIGMGTSLSGNAQNLCRITVGTGVGLLALAVILSGLGAGYLALKGFEGADIITIIVTVAVILAFINSLITFCY